jgi:hypothetical protein
VLANVGMKDLTPEFRLTPKFLAVLANVGMKDLTPLSFAIGSL